MPDPRYSRVSYFDATTDGEWNVAVYRSLACYRPAPRAVDDCRQKWAVSSLSQPFPGRRRGGQTAEAAIVSFFPSSVINAVLAFLPPVETTFYHVSLA